MASPRVLRHWRPGAPEGVGLALITLVVMLAVKTWLAANMPPWPRTLGTVLSCAIRSVHYNAEPNDTKVTLTYEYVANGQTYAGNWQGLWPATGSANALPPERLHELEEPGYRLYVYYDPRNPAISRLEDGSRDSLFVYAMLFVGCLAIFLVYLIRFYPAWRLSRAR